jgi:hypothetical protein
MLLVNATVVFRDTWEVTILLGLLSIGILFRQADHALPGVDMPFRFLRSGTKRANVPRGCVSPQRLFFEGENGYE